MRTLVLCLLIGVGGFSCIETTTSRGRDTREQPEPTAVQANGNGTNDEYIKSLSTLERSRRESKLIDAESNYNLNPSELNTIWYGRRLGYLGRFQEAIDIFSAGIEQFPESYKLLRHRGHRYLTIRQFDLAIEDLTNAAFYSNSAPNDIEPDGIPNSLNKPLSNTKFNIWYHLGLSYYMKGNYDKAISSFKKCESFANNNDLKVKMANWMYASYRKLGNTELADQVAENISTRMSIIETENRRYHDLIMLYRGFVTPGILIQRNTVNSVLDANVGYGIGNFYLLEGQVQNAQTIFNRVLNSDQWDAFGYISCEAENQKLINR